MLDTLGNNFSASSLEVAVRNFFTAERVVLA